MATNVVDVAQGAADNKAEALKAQVEAQFNAALEQAALELTQTGVGNQLNRWEVYAWGPWQNPPALPPGRIIMTGEKAYIAAGVWLNNAMLADLLGFGAHIELNFFTSNTQTMMPLSALDFRCCIYPAAGQNFYTCIWEFTPSEAACLYETNMCARVCSCNGLLVPDYAGFVRHVYDFEPDNLFPPYPFPPGWQFDRPIRYLVADRNSKCDCPPQP
ncbi:MAG: hypothetical protein KDE47_20230 [Caldilineaceae bacterium]|nr:hypothetical protein [Caldilineaceae bacterium]